MPRDFLKDARDHYDIVVIGSGLAGLTSANTLARAGYSVLLLEHHYQLGGMATWFKRQNGHIFDISLHGFPIGMMLYYQWFNIFIAWLIKVLVLRYGGAAAYRRTQPFFLGLITGHCLCIVGWLIIDSFTGQTRNITLQM